MEFNATFFVTAISFIVFTFIMTKFFYAPLTKVIDEREDFINKTGGRSQRQAQARRKTS